MAILNINYIATPGPLITDEQFKQCASVFSAHYGVWDSTAAAQHPSLKAGSRVKMTPHRLKSQCASKPDDTTLITAHIDGQTVGHAFATRWKYGAGIVCWVTQLVVVSEYRRRRIATSMLSLLRDQSVVLYGLVSSHPGACVALHSLGPHTLGADGVDLDFIRKHGESVIKSTTVDYLKSARLKGQLFEAESDPSIISCADTGFYVDHREVEDALLSFNEKWPLGMLPNGHEFFLIVPGHKDHV